MPVSTKMPKTHQSILPENYTLLCSKAILVIFNSVWKSTNFNGPSSLLPFKPFASHKYILCYFVLLFVQIPSRTNSSRHESMRTRSCLFLELLEILDNCRTHVQEFWHNPGSEASDTLGRYQIYVYILGWLAELKNSV